MNFSTLFKVGLLATLLALSACGGSGNHPGGSGPGGNNPGGSDPDTTPDAFSFEPLHNADLGIAYSAALSSTVN